MEGHATDALLQLRDQMLTVDAHAGDGVGHGRCRDLGGHAHGGDQRRCLGAAPQAAFLAAAMQQRFEDHAAAHVQAADALGSAELVPGERQGVDAQCLDIHRDLAYRLHAIDVEMDPPPLQHLGDLAHRLQGADFIVHQHDRHQPGIVPQRLAYPLGADQAFTVRRQAGDLEAEDPFQVRGDLEDRRMLDGRDDDVGGLRHTTDGAAGEQRALDRPVVGLGASRGEGQLGRRAVHQAGDLLPGGGQGVAVLLGQLVDARRIAEVVEGLAQCVGGLLVHRRRGVVIEITESRHPVLPQAALYCRNWLKSDLSISRQ